MTEKNNWYTYRATILFETPYIAPALSPNKAMKKLQIQDIMKCYDDDLKELVEHLDRAFVRDSQCNVIVPGHVFSASLRESLGKNNIIVRGSVKINKEFVRIGTSRAGNSLLIYEYIIPGTTVDSLFQINYIMPEKIIIYIGARKLKGFGRVQIKFEPASVPNQR